MDVTLRRWWSRKYKRPWQCSEEFGALTIEELLLEYYEDYFEQNPRATMKELVDEKGHYRFAHTGDPLIDKWEDELARGINPDLEEGLDSEAKRQLAREREASGKARGYIPDADKIDDDYARLAQKRRDNPPMYDKEHAILGDAVDEDELEDLLGIS